jgi:hypothetical protein
MVQKETFKISLCPNFGGIQGWLGRMVQHPVVVVVGKVVPCAIIYRQHTVMISNASLCRASVMLSQTYVCPTAGSTHTYAQKQASFHFFSLHMEEKRKNPCASKRIYSVMTDHCGSHQRCHHPSPMNVNDTGRRLVTYTIFRL